MEVRKILIIVCSTLLFASCKGSDIFGEQVQLLNFENKNKTVTLAEGALERLFLDPQVSDREVVIVSIAGALRKGKSFLLNYMLRYLYANYRSINTPDKAINEANDWIGDPNEPLKGFGWKSSTQRETTGILFWSDIFLHETSNGDKIAIYLVDTQGLFDHYSSPTDNIRIFSLSALMSSVQIMNMFNNLQESDLDFLQFATEVALFTAVDDESIKPFQKLFYIIRDWSTPDEYDYGHEGGNQFIKSFLTIRDFHSEELKKVRQYVQKSFDSIEGFLMPHPGKIVARNSSYDGRWGLIDEDFVDVMKELVPLLLAPKNLVVKTVNGVTVKAFELAVHMKQYIDLFKSESLPEAKTIYDSTLDSQFNILMSKSVEIYVQSIQLFQNNITVEDEIESLHNLSMAITLRYFDDEKKFGNEQEILSFRNQLIHKLKKAYDEWKPISLELLNKIKVEQAEADKQRVLAEKSKSNGDQFNQKADKLEAEYKLMQKKLETARYDSVESRKEADLIKKRLEQTVRERNEALKKAKEERQRYEELFNRVNALEQQLLYERENAQRQVNTRVQKIRKNDGILQYFQGVVLNFNNFIQKTYRSIASFFSFGAW
ncbi:hypothetical protein ACKWTF_010375 [Chironomus riparius]